jgi:hypothetical protein
MIAWVKIPTLPFIFNTVDKKTKLRGSSPQSIYTDQETAASRRS